MKGMPIKMSTGKDFTNCLAMVQAGELDAAELQAHIDALEARQFVEIPIIEMSADRKSVVIMACDKVNKGMEILNIAAATVSSLEMLEAPVRGGMVAEMPLESGAPVKGGGERLPVGDLTPIEAEPVNTLDPVEAIPEQERVTLTKALPAGTTHLRVQALTDPFEAIGITRAEIQHIREVLNNG